MAGPAPGCGAGRGGVIDDRQRARLAFHGLVIFVLGLIIGIPFSMLFTKSDDQHPHLWGVAHLEALVHRL